MPSPSAPSAAAPCARTGATSGSPAAARRRPSGRVAAIAADSALAYRFGAKLAQLAPGPLGEGAAKQLGRAAGWADIDRRKVVVAALERVYGRKLSAIERVQKVDAVFAAYARYYHESFRLPTMSVRELDRNFSADGYERLSAAIADGHGPILAMPHLGSWEWAGFWLTRVKGHPVTCVVERLEPPEVFTWFRELRESLGLNVVPLGPEAGPAVLKAIADRHIVVLICDRQIGDGASIDVEFFGEHTRLPAGPATIGLRTGTPVFPATVYSTRRGCHAVVRPAVPMHRHGTFRHDVARITQDVTRELEVLIAAEPEQWHILQPNWPSDPGWPAGQ